MRDKRRGSLHVPSAIEVRHALNRVTGSDIFRSSDRLNRFLTFVVETRLAEQECPKESEIARTVYGRLAAYDSRLDPIVRVEAHRLRLKLHEYYATTGADDEIEILIPKGGYRPDFRWRRHGDDSRPAGDAAATRLLVLPFVVDSAPDRTFADGLTDELISALARTPGLRVIGRTSAFQLQVPTANLRRRIRQLGASIVLEGSLRRNSDRVHVNVHLVDESDGASIWSGVFDRAPKDVLDLQEELGLAITTAVRDALEAQRDPRRRQ
jgi:serine/threonine-protein kinase